MKLEGIALVGKLRMKLERIALVGKLQMKLETTASVKKINMKLERSDCSMDKIVKYTALKRKVNGP